MIIRFCQCQFLNKNFFFKIASNTADFRIPNINLEMFPKEAYTGNWLVAFRLVIPIYMVMALSQFITYLLILIVGEKEKHIKEGLKIMGLRDSVFWLSWFIIYGFFVAFLSLLSVFLLFSLGVFQFTNYFPVFLLILLYSLSVILIGFMITPFFDNSRVSLNLMLAISLAEFYFLISLDGRYRWKLCCEHHVLVLFYSSFS